jgi:hypothetical protein
VGDTGVRILKAAAMMPATCVPWPKTSTSAVGLPSPPAGEVAVQQGQRDVEGGEPVQVAGRRWNRSPPTMPALGEERAPGVSAFTVLTERSMSGPSA